MRDAGIANRNLLYATTLTREALAARLERDPKTIEAWHRGRPIPATVRKLLEIYAGAMPWPGFERYRVDVRERVIVPPGCRDGVPVSVLDGLPWTLARLEVVDARLRELEAAPAQYLLELEAAANDP